MRLMADLAAYWHFISGKLASVDGPYGDKRGRIVYSLVIGGQHQRWLRSHANALKLAARHNENEKVSAMAREQGQALIAELLAENTRPQ